VRSSGLFKEVQAAYFKGAGGLLKIRQHLRRRRKRRREQKQEKSKFRATVQSTFLKTVVCG